MFTQQGFYLFLVLLHYQSVIDDLRTVLAVANSPCDFIGTVFICVAVRHAHAAVHALAVLALCDAMAHNNAAKDVLAVLTITEVQGHLICVCVLEGP